MEMALTECFECKRSISSETPSCIHCGAPVAARQATTSRATPLSFGQLPRDEWVPEVEPIIAEPAPTIAPAPVPEISLPVSQHRRRGAPPTPPAPEVWPRPVEGWLKIMAFLVPPIFAWFFLRRGHSLQQRLIAFGWMGLLILASSMSPKP
jgi:hypothetical protein